MKQQILFALAILFLILFVIFIFRFAINGGEDAWSCSEGQWVKHGNPSGPVPTIPCYTNEATQGNNTPSF
jgi:hypothetical protein